MGKNRVTLFRTIVVHGEAVKAGMMRPLTQRRIGFTVNFTGSKTIDEIDVFSLHDN